MSYDSFFSQAEITKYELSLLVYFSFTDESYIPCCSYATK